jgi:cathepsin L
MKTHFFLILAFCIGFLNTGFAQTTSDPLQQFYRKRDVAKIEQSLTTFGKSALDADKKFFSSIRNATFTLEPNLTLNRPLSQLAGTITPVGDNSSELKLQFERIKAEIPTIQREFEAKQFYWNPDYFIDLRLIDWKKILMGASGCTINTGYLTPVKDQLSCGSCWAFSAAATWEHSYKKIFSSAVNHNLSEEDMVNCGKTCAGDDAGSCSGGHTFKAFEYIRCFKVATEANYPYTATNAACIAKPKTYGAFFNGQVGTNVSFPTTDQVKAAITLYGAVTTYVFARGWSSYGTGVLNAIPNAAVTTYTYTGSDGRTYACGANYINHAVTIVGWCDAKNAWIIKNSWGTDWGSYGGYAYVAYNTYNIAKYVYYVVPLP